MSATAKSKCFRMFDAREIEDIILREDGRFFLQIDTGHFIIVTSKRGSDEDLVIVISPDDHGELCVVTQRHIHETDPRKKENFMEIENLDLRLFG